MREQVPRGSPSNNVPGTRETQEKGNVSNIPKGTLLPVGFEYSSCLLTQPKGLLSEFQPPSPSQKFTGQGNERAKTPGFLPKPFPSIEHLCVVTWVIWEKTHEMILLDCEEVWHTHHICILRGLELRESCRSTTKPWLLHVLAVWPSSRSSVSELVSFCNGTVVFILLGCC